MPSVTVPSPADQTPQGDDARTVCVVVPIPADPPWELFDAIPDDIPIIVSDDSDGKLAPPPRANVHYFDYAAQRAYAGEHFAAMPHKSAACRNIGHYIAWKEGFDVVIALDYDCQTRPGWLTTHLDALGTRVDAPGLRPVEENGWVNPITASFPNGDAVYARGLPYEWRAPELAEVVEAPVSGRVAVNLGLWDGILDLNGVDKLYGGEPGDPGVEDGVQRVALGNIPICGMNTGFVRDVIPAYFFLPDLWINGWQLSRHDDIWGGYVVKRLMDRRGDLLSFGGPVVGHTKQTRLERVAVLEQWMHLMSMPFYDIVDEAADRVDDGPYEQMFAQFAEEYARLVDKSRAPSHFRDVYRELGEWMARWARAFR
jgi:hypothetical protein